MGLLLALGIALAVSALIELARRLHLWPRLMALYRRLAGRPGPEATDDTGSETAADEREPEPGSGEADLTEGHPDRPGVPSR